MTRAFVAIVPPAPVLDAIGAFAAGLPMLGARPTPRDQWHLTLQFLGDDAAIDEVEAAFARAPLDAGEHTIRLGGAVVFGDVVFGDDASGGIRRARVIALGVQEGGDWIAAVAGQVASRLLPLGFAPADGGRSFVPHLTLGRFRAPTDARPFRTAVVDKVVAPAWRAGDVVLFESRLHPDGAQHRACATIPTGRGAR